METTFLLAERIVHQLKCAFLNGQKTHENYYFKESIITDSSFKIIFTNRNTEIILFLSLHHLDMPWKIEATIIENNSVINFNSLMLNRQNKNSIYNVYPNLLKDPNGLGNKLAKEIAQDLLHYFNISA